MNQMKKIMLTIIISFYVCTGFGQQSETSKLSARFDQILAEQFGASDPGAVVIVTRKGEVIYKKAFGMANLEHNLPMQPDNVFRIASITKQFTAIAILQLMEKGRLSLQDEITKYIPNYPMHGHKITIEHLLTHTSGIPDYTGIPDTVQNGKRDFTPVQMIDRFKNLPLNFLPGTKWAYSNSGYYLLGYVIEQLSGKTYGSYLEENIFKPVGMTSSLYANDTKLVRKRVSGYTQGKTSYDNASYISMSQPYAAGSILSTVEDLFTWQQAVVSYKLVQKHTLDKAFSRYKLADGKEAEYGYGWKTGFVYGSPIVWHGGLINGFRTMSLYLPNEDIYVSILTNCDCAQPEGATYKLAALAAGRPETRKEMTVTKNILESYSGVYENEKGQQRVITMKDGKLYSQLGRGPKALLRSYDSDKLYYDGDAMATILFNRNKEGMITQLTLENLRSSDVWIRTQKPLPNEDGIKVSEEVLKAYTGVYEIQSGFNFDITLAAGKLSLQATGQDKFDLFAETPVLFFVKVNDAQLEFIKDAAGKVIKAVLKQGGRTTDAKKIK